MPKSFSARIFIALIVIAGFLVLGNSALNARHMPTVRSVAFLVVACLAARLKIKLPALTGTMSVNLPFILLAAAEMNTAEALAVGFISTLVQCLAVGKQKINPVHVAFSCCTITLAAAVTRLIYMAPAVTAMVPLPHLRLAVGAVGYCLTNTILVAIVIGLTEAVSVVRTWVEMWQLSFPYLVASAGVAALALAITQETGWQVPLAVLPIMAGIFLSYRRYFLATTITQSVRTAVQAPSRMTAGAHV
jgi:hypothetical protein